MLRNACIAQHQPVSYRLASARRRSERGLLYCYHGLLAIPDIRSHKFDPCIHGIGEAAKRSVRCIILKESFMNAHRYIPWFPVLILRHGRYRSHPP
jgi:hypothetical protein